MGGRVYDPILGRFLQADPFVQQPNNIQNFNRYSYVLNNPLNKTDPSGYFFQMLVVWAVQYVAATAATSAIGTALGAAHAAGKTAAKPVDNKQGSTNTDGHTNSGNDGRYLNNTEKATLNKDLRQMNERVSKIDNFKTHEKAAEWLHDNALSLTDTHGAEVYARIYEHADGFKVSNIISSYHTSRVDVVDINSVVGTGRLVADWHTHPAVGSANFSQQDYQTRLDRYVSFNDYWQPSGLRHYDGINAWKALGYNPSPALPDMTLEHGDKFSYCKKGGC